MRKQLVAALCISALGTTLGAAAVHADRLDDIGKKLVGFGNEVSNIGSGVRRPDALAPKGYSNDLATRRLIDARVNFGVGNYDNAAVMLYDFVEKNRDSPSWDEGLYYLAEALFQKGDNLAARTYFTKLVSEVGSSSKFNQQALERLIELTLKLDDAAEVSRWLAALDAVPAAKLRASVPYVRGKYAYHRDQFDEALSWFAKVPPDSKYSFQSEYFKGVALVAKKDIGPAADAFSAVLRRAPATDDQRRVVELTHMALGRLYYERDQPSKAIDEYLRISRKSDLFDDALYEVAWVYVKNKDFSKALRALELLAIADPTSNRMPEVRILEGNLRIRKAQYIAGAGGGNAKEEYDRALAVFDDTKSKFAESKNEIDRLMAEQLDPSGFLEQITGRSSKTFEVQSTLPEVAAAWLRQEAGVKRVISIETDLGQINDEIEEAQETVKRLEAALTSRSRVNIFPSLAERRVRATEILDELFALRQELAAQERSIFGKNATPAQQSQLDSLGEKRRAISAELAKLPNSGLVESDRIGAARNQYDEIDKRAAEVATILRAAEAELVAIEKYSADSGEPADKSGGEIAEGMKELRELVDGLNEELGTIRKEVVVAKDSAGTGDEVAKRRDVLRGQLRAALDAEHRSLQAGKGSLSGSDRTKVDQISSLTQKANSVTVEIDRLNQNIDSIVDQALVEVQSALQEEKSALAAYRGEFLNYESESHGLGGEVLGLSFSEVSKKFFQILIRSDVGIVDVAWSLKEAADQGSRRLTLEQAHQRRTLDAEFAEVIRDIRRNNERREAAPAAAPETKDPESEQGGGAEASSSGGQQ